MRYLALQQQWNRLGGIAPLVAVPRRCRLRDMRRELPLVLFMQQKRNWQRKELVLVLFMQQKRINGIPNGTTGTSHRIPTGDIGVIMIIMGGQEHMSARPAPGQATPGSNKKNFPTKPRWLVHL